MPTARLSAWLTRTSPAVFSLVAMTAAFSTYFSMYAFRKPFGAARFDQVADIWLFGAILIDYKVVLVIAQTLGYAMSKFTGIKIISELTPSKRAAWLVGLLAFSHLALLAFAILPSPYNAVGLFLNGLPLGMVWGVVFGFLEGRRTSELLGAALSASYILASGYTKAIGKVLLAHGISELWMPFAAASLFWPVLLVSIFVLAALPPPSAQDEAERTRRQPMNRAARRDFFRRFWPGLISLMTLYVVMTAYRDFRDNFAAELWRALGYGHAPSVFATSENWVALGVMITLAALLWVKNNRHALIAVHLLMIVGTMGIGLLTGLYAYQLIDGYSWMVGIGLGLYMAYVPYGCILFDRMIAAVGVTATAGFMIYLSDTVGYAGSVALLLFRELAAPQLSWLSFFQTFSWLTSVLCTALYVVSLVYFMYTTRPSPA